MSDERRETTRPADSWWGREAAPRRALAAAALMLVALVATGALGLAYALAAVLVVAVAAWIGSGRRAPTGVVASLPERRGPRLGDPGGHGQHECRREREFHHLGCPPTAADGFARRSYPETPTRPA